MPLLLHVLRLDHSCRSPPIAGDTPKKSPAKRVDFKKVGGKFGGDVPPPLLGGKLNTFPAKFWWSIPPKATFLLGNPSLVGTASICWGFGQKSSFPSKIPLFGGDIRGFSLQICWEISKKWLSHQSCWEQKVCPPPKSERVGGGVDNYA